MKDVVIYKSDHGSINVTLEQDNVWLSQRQMGKLFETSPENVLMHLQNTFRENELGEEATAKNFLVVQTEGSRQVRRQVKHYNLDAVISVGYRVNSKKGVQFRQWATGVLKQHLQQGYTLNQKRFEDNAREREKALLMILKTAERADLVNRKEAGSLFGQKRGDSFLSILGNLDQSVFGQPAYPTVEARPHIFCTSSSRTIRFRMQQTQCRHALSGLSEPEWAFDAGGWKPGRQRCRTDGLGLACCGVGPQGQGCADPADHEHADDGSCKPGLRFPLGSRGRFSLPLSSPWPPPQHLPAAPRAPLSRGTVAEIQKTRKQEIKKINDLKKIMPRV